MFSKAQTQERNHLVTRISERKGEAVGFSTHGATQRRGVMARKGTDRSRITTTCTHCDKFGHDQDNCFELLGYPDLWYYENRPPARGRGRNSRGGRNGGSNRVRGNVVANVVGHRASGAPHQLIGEGDRFGLPSVSDEQWHKVLDMFKVVNVNSSTAKLDGKTLSTRWIIDTGCSNHMSGNKSLFNSLNDANASPVDLPNGKQVMATKEGNMQFSEHLQLTGVLYVPELNCNLISVS